MFKRLRVLLGMDTTEFDSKLKGAKGKTEEFSKGGSSAMGSFAAAIAAVTGAFMVLKNAIGETATGIDNFNILATVSKQIMYDMLHRTPWPQMKKNIDAVVDAQADLNYIRKKEREEMYKSKLLYANYQKFLVDAHDQTLSNTARVQAYDYALTGLNMSLNEQEKSLKLSLNAIQKLLKAAPDNEKYLIEESRLKNALIDLEVRRFSGQKEIASMRSGLLKSEAAEVRKLAEEYNKVNKAATEMLNALPKSNTPTSVFQRQEYGLSPALPGIQSPQEQDMNAAIEKAKKLSDAVADNSGELEAMQDALVGLAGQFSGFFSDVNLGFQGMIDGVITGIKRLVMELAAKAAILGLLSLIPGMGQIFSLGNILGGKLGGLIGGGGGGGAGSIGNIPSSGGGGEVVFKIAGTALKGVLGNTDRSTNSYG